MHLGTFVKADEKVDALVYAMFPGRAPVPPAAGPSGAPQQAAPPGSKPAQPSGAPAAPAVSQPKASNG
jgi:hypothetical protein